MEAMKKQNDLLKQKVRSLNRYFKKKKKNRKTLLSFNLFLYVLFFVLTKVN